MVDYKRILKLSSENYSLRQIAASVGHSHHTVKDVLELAQKRGITHPLDDSVTNADLEKLLYPERQSERYIQTAKKYTCVIFTNIYRRGIIDRIPTISGRATSNTACPAVMLSAYKDLSRSQRKTSFAVFAARTLEFIIPLWTL